MGNITKLILDLSLKHNNKTFLINESDTKLSFKEFHENLLQTELFFDKNNLFKDTKSFSIIAPNCLSYLLVLFTFLKENKTAVNLNPALHTNEIIEKLASINVDTLVTTKEFYEQLDSSLKDTNINTIIIIEEKAFEFKNSKVIKLSKNNIISKKIENPVAFYQFTGGTSGTVKAAIITHDNVIGNIEQLNNHINKDIILEDIRIIIAFPFYHIFSIIFNVLYFMSIGATCILNSELRNFDKIIDLAIKNKVNFMVGVNTWYNKLMLHPQFNTIDFSNFKAVFAGGEYVPVTTKSNWKKMTKLPMYSAYGLTETCSLTIISPLNGTNIDDALGVPVPGCEVILLDKNNIKVKQGEVGEICLKGVNVIQEYYNNVKETENAFYDGCFKTGDLAIQLENGQYKLMDRKKDMISVSGNKVYPNEVESVITKIDGILDVGVVSKACSKSGERVAACIVLETNSTITADDIINYCKKNLSSFKVPKNIYFYTELPKTAIGKTARRILKQEINTNENNRIL